MRPPPRCTLCPYTTLFRSGQTQSPDASTSRPPRPPTAPTALIRPAATATSATRRGAPLPSITVPPRITRSIIPMSPRRDERSEEHTSELQSRQYLVCRLLL